MPSSPSLKRLAQGFRQLLKLQQQGLSWDEQARAVLVCFEAALDGAAFILWVGSSPPVLSSRLERIEGIQRKLPLLKEHAAVAPLVDTPMPGVSPRNGLPLSFTLQELGSLPPLGEFRHYHSLCLVDRERGSSAWLGVLQGPEKALAYEGQLLLDVGALLLSRALEKHEWAQVELSEPESDAYGEGAVILLETVASGLAGITAEFMEQKWDLGVSDPSVAQVLQNLTQIEVEYFKTLLCCHLQYVLAPGTRRRELIESSRASGWRRIHVGVDIIFFLRILSSFRLRLQDYLDRQSALESTRYHILRVIDLRLQDDIEAQVQGQEAVRLRAMEYISRPLPERMGIWADAVAEEIRAVGHLPGIMAALLIRMGSDGHYRIEAGAGPKRDEVVATLELCWDEVGDYDLHLSAESLMVRAWQTAEVQSSANFALQRRSRYWDRFFSRLRVLGAQCSAHIPVLNEKGKTVAVVTLMGAYPNQFESRWAHQFLRNMQQRWGEIWFRCAKPAPPIPLEESIAYRQRLFAGGLTMFVQPVVDLYSGQCLSVEALARLVMKDGRVVSPGLFIPLLGDSELDRLFRQGLELTLAQLVQWQAEGINVGLSLNLPPSTLMDPDCVQWVEEALQSHGVGAECLTLELLETEAVDAESKDSAIEHLISRGIKLAMDDLGSGYSSLKRLANLPFDTIKVDQDLLAHIREAPVKTLSLISAIIQMGIDFDHHVVVEGLEDEGMVEAALILGAHRGQGYGIARPMLMEAFADWYRSTKTLVKPDQLKTPLGALAFHWRATRQGQHHASDLRSCPLTAFLSRQHDRKKAVGWHAAFHALRPPAEESNHLLQYLESLSRS